MTVFVISSSQLGAKEKHTANVIKLMNGPGVHHYWDGQQHVGAAVQRFVAGLEFPAWDFWMLYRPGVLWGPEKAPEPDWWEHQLGALHRDFAQRQLDAERYAKKALELSSTHHEHNAEAKAKGRQAF